jgi:hypothetical protein
MITEYTIRHRTRGDVGGFGSHTEAAAVALSIGWPLEDWEIEPVEAPARNSFGTVDGCELHNRVACDRCSGFAPFADMPQTPARDRAIDRWARA